MNNAGRNERGKLHVVSVMNQLLDWSIDGQDDCLRMNQLADWGTDGQADCLDVSAMNQRANWRIDG